MSRACLDHVSSETSEGRFVEAESLDEAVRLARTAALGCSPDETVSVEHKGRVIRQVARPTGARGVSGQAVAELVTPAQETEG